MEVCAGTACKEVCAGMLVGKCALEGVVVW
jgi:hypothetical protein